MRGTRKEYLNGIIGDIYTLALHCYPRERQEVVDELKAVIREIETTIETHEGLLVVNKDKGVV